MVIKIPARVGISTVAASGTPPMPKSGLFGEEMVATEATGTAGGTAGDTGTTGGTAGEGVAVIVAATVSLWMYWSALAKKPAISALDRLPLLAEPDFAMNLFTQRTGFPGT